LNRTDALSLVGLGNLGQTLAVCLAWRGLDVVGIDVNEAVIASLEEGVATIVEPEVQSMLNDCTAHLHPTREHARAIADTDVTFLLVATPSAEDGSFSLANLETALQDLGSALRGSSKESHLFIVGSTVSPGSMERLVSLLEETSGRCANDGFEVCYCPELVALGTAAHDFLNPDAVVIGESCVAAGERAAAVYRRLCRNNPAHLHMRLAEAEVAKLALNCYLALKISFGNSIATLCEALPGLDSSAVTALLQRDRRIGKGYLDGGLPYGGPCFPRDMLAYLEVARRIGDPAHLIAAAEDVNRSQPQRLAGRVLNELAVQRSSSVTILGIAYKENASLLAGSTGVALTEILLQNGVQVIVHDPLAMVNARRRFGESVRYAPELEDALRESRVIVITTRDPEFATITGAMLPEESCSVIDCWRLLNPDALTPGCRHITLGRSADLVPAEPVLANE
jgi:UDPglucose 6-dehydrogenase